MTSNADPLFSSKIIYFDQKWGSLVTKKIKQNVINVTWNCLLLKD